MSNLKEYQIPQWQIDQVKDRSKKYFQSSESAVDLDNFLKEIDNGL